MADTALQFDAIQNYIDATTLGGLGSHIIADGFSLEFNIVTTQATQGQFGVSQSGSFNQLIVIFNCDHNFSTSSGKIAVQFSNNSGNQLVAATTTGINFNDGNPHTIEITAILGATKTVTLKIDGVSKSISYSNRDTISTFIDFPNAFGFGARLRGATPAGFMACTIDNVKIGTLAAVYGSYAMDEGAGTTAADSSGNAFDATLHHGAGADPAWVAGIGQAPYVFTSPATLITDVQATGNGDVGSSGGFPITERGIVWSTSANPTTSDNKVIVAGTTGVFSGNIAGLTIYTTYHYRAYAINALGTSYGADVSFFTATGKTGMMMGI